MAYKTLDIVKINSAEEVVGIIEEVIPSIPELGYFQASPVTKNTYKTLCVSALPTTGFRAVGSDRVFDSATLANRTTTLRYCDASWILGKDEASACDWGVPVACSLQAKTHLKSALFEVSKAIWNGSYNGTTDFAFTGFTEVIEAANCAIVDAGNSSITDGTSVFAVSTGLESAQLAFGNNGEIKAGDIVEQLIAYTSSGDKLGRWFYCQSIEFYAALQITSKWAGGMIKNLSAANGKKGLDDDMLYELIAKFPVGATPTAIFMNRRSLEQLRASRTATNATGSPAPTPEFACGNIPIYVTDAIGNDGVVS